MVKKIQQVKIVEGLSALDNQRHFRLRLFIEGIVIGLLTGTVVSSYRWILEKCNDYRPLLYAQFTWDKWYNFALYCLLMLIVAYILYRIVKREPLCSGSGIPQIKGVLLGKMHMNWVSILISKYIGGILAIGSGLSLGREGPSVQLGASLAQGISRTRNRSRMEERFLLVSGASAGLAAAFSAPLAGVIFGFEELYRNFSPLVLMGSAIASVIAVAITHIVFGNGPIFAIGMLKMLPLSMYGWLAVLGVFIGVLGFFYSKFLFMIMDWYDNQKILKKMWKPALPLFMAVFLGFYLPQVLAGGDRLADSLVRFQFGIGLLCILYLAKMFFTMFAFGSGVPGGLFLPMLVLGAVSGSIFNHILAFIGVTDPTYAPNFVVFAMAAYFGAVVKAPITGAALLMEMTGSFEHMQALIYVSMIAYLVADWMGGQAVYDALMVRRLRAQNKTVQAKEALSYRRVIMEKVVGNGCIADGKMVKSVEWPKNTLIVNVKRGEDTFVPNGDTRLQAGDYLYILAKDDNIEVLQDMLTETAKYTQEDKK